jgi:hypothetical protein
MEDLAWQITWIRAFPWLVLLHPSLLRHASRYGSDDQAWSLVWQRLALRSLWDSVPPNDDAVSANRAFMHEEKCNNSAHVTSFLKNRQSPSTENYASYNQQAGGGVADSEKEAPPPTDPLWPNSTGYGEIKDESITEIIAYMHQKGYLSVNALNQRTLTMVDLGSGSGRVLISACLACQYQIDSCLPPPTRANSAQILRYKGLGYELVPSRHMLACQRLYHLHRRLDLHADIKSGQPADFDAWTDNYHEGLFTSGSSDSCSIMCGVAAVDSRHSCGGLEIPPPTCIASSFDVSFYCADFTTDTSWVQTADLIWIHSTVFEQPLMSKLASLCRECRRGTLFVMVSKPLESTGSGEDLPAFRTLNVLRLPMDWGLASVYLQVRA